MRKWRGFADNGACPIDPIGGGTCWKKSQAQLITESALPLHGENLGVGGRVLCIFLGNVVMLVFLFIFAGDKKKTANMTKEEKVQYWLDIATEDLDLAEFLFTSKRWLYSAFMCHQVIEKMLKAYWTATCDDVPPYIHEHKRLAELCGLYEQMNDEQCYFIEEIRPMNIEARYPDYKRSIANSLNEEKIKKIVEQTKQMQQWILQKCLLEMKPSNLSGNTNE